MKLIDFGKKNWEIISLVIVIIVTTILSFADFISQDEAFKYAFVADASLAISILIGLYKNERSILTLSQSTSTTTDRTEHYKLLNCAAIKANKEILLMTIDTALNTGNRAAIPEREIYYSTLENIANKKQITIERIYGLPIDPAARKDKIKWIKEDLNKFKNCSNYHMYIFDWKNHTSIIKPLSLQIIDNSFVGLVDIRSSENILGSGNDLCVTDPAVVEYFRSYYSEIRDKCFQLKISNNINDSILNQIN